MASLRPALLQLRGRPSATAPQWQQLRQMLQGVQSSPKAKHTRLLSTTPPLRDNSTLKNDSGRRSLEDARSYLEQLGLENDEPQRKPATDRHTNTASSSSTTQSSDTTVPVEFSASMAAAMEAINEVSGDDTEPARERGTRRAERGQHGSERWDGREQQAGRGQWAGRETGPTSLGGREMGQASFGGRGRPDEWEEGDEEGGEETAPKVEKHVRAMPVSPSYFSRQPEFNDSFLRLQTLMRRFSHLPTAPSDQLQKVAFRTLKDFRLSVGENIKASEYAKCMTLVRRLNKIHPNLQPVEVNLAIKKFTRDINPHIKKAKEIPIDKFGRALGVGKRKTSTARAWVVEGTGEVLVNGKSLADAFGRVHDRDTSVWALKATARTDKYNVWALVDGGGTTGQAEALAMAVGKALMAHEPALKPALRRGE